MKLKVGDPVVVITGKNKGKTGKIIRVQEKQNRVVIEDVNKVKRHVRKTSQRPGQVLEFEAPIHASNVMIVDPKSKKRVRVGYNVDSKGKKVRIAKQSKNSL